MKRYFPRAKVGDIMRFSRFYDVKTNWDGSYIRETTWAVVHEISPHESIHRQECQILILTGRCAGQVHIADTSDSGRIIKPEKVPDEIWAAVAKWKLLKGE